jgi:hypothetical protein
MASLERRGLLNERALRRIAKREAGGGDLVTDLFTRPASADASDAEQP